MSLHYNNDTIHQLWVTLADMLRYHRKLHNSTIILYDILNNMIILIMPLLTYQSPKYLFKYIIIIV